MRTKRLALIALASSIALALAFAYAHVMSYYPVNVTLAPSAPKIIFAYGSNAGATDIDGSTIDVTIGNNGANLTLTLHPTYETTYYKNITIIKNTGNKAYTVSIVVNDPLSLGVSGAHAYLIVWTSNAPRNPAEWGWPVPVPPQPPTTVGVIDLTQTSTVTLGELGATSFWEVDLLVYIPEGSTPSVSTAKLYLVATPG